MDPSPPPHPYSHLWNVNHAADIRMLRDQEREKAEQERERLEKLRGAEQAVDKHFEESLRPQRLAQHKQRSGWNMAPSFPPNTRIVEDPNRMRERFFPSHSSPVLHPHARFPVKPEPTPVQAPSPFKMFSYLPTAGLPVTMIKPEPIPDVKNSVIVKNEKKQVTGPMYRTNNNSLLIEAPNLQRPVYMNYSHPPAPKVVSPAPAHIYGKPSNKPPLSTSPYQQIPPHQPPPVSTKLPTPPPAHSGGTTSTPYVPNHCDSQQSQPLDLGLSLVKSVSPSPPKRKLDQNDLAVSPAKKACPPITILVEQQEPLSLSASVPVETIPALTPLIVSEPSSLTTSPVPTPTLLPSSVVVTNENSNSSTGSLPPSKTESSAGGSSSGAHKLKKAWLQRHSGVESTTPPPVTPPPAAISTPPPPPLPPLTITSNINGHGASEDSSSSEEDELAKRVPPKVKRKKKSGSSTPSKKTSPSSTDSDKESDSGGKKANGNNSPSKSNNSAGKGDASGNRKRSKKKDSSDGNDESGGSSDKKSRDNNRKDDDKGHRDPCQKPPVSQLKKTGESWLQDGPCFEVAPKLSKCRECRWTPNQRSRNNSNIFCRFYAFRRLRYTKNGQLAIAGFSDPHKDAGPEDIKLWLPDPVNPPKDIDLELGRFILLQLADQFCVLLHQEDEAVDLNMSEDSTVAWKRVVQGVREMCDVCETTLFNFHWACSKCGFVVCIDCYRDRKTGCNKVWGDGAKDRDEASWLLCNNRQPHEQDKLMLTQIIAGNCLDLLKEKILEYKIANNLPLYFKPEKDKVKEKIKEECPETPLDWLADVALNKQKNTSNSTSNSSNTNTGSSSVSATESKADTTGTSGGGGGFSKLRKLLIRRPNPMNDKSDSGAESTSESSNTTPVKTEPGASSCEETVPTAAESSSNSNSTVLVPACSQASAEPSAENSSSNNTVELKHFQRLKDYSWSSSPQLDIRILTNAESKRLYPDVPHAWLCDGKLLRLTDPVSPGNYKIFQDMWRRGQPVLVSGVGAQLDQTLWHPDSFAADFGDLRNDLINCATGNTVPNQSMRRFWEGFEYCSKRLKDDAGQGMLLKLKDWPPSDDFAELLPTRFADLMRVLPLGEYTQRSGRLNLASRLPECFVKPDLGPKMYIAYGNYLYPSKATTNLHLDISDAVNLMVHVGIPKDGDHSEYMREAYRAIDEGGSDILTRRRVRVKGELPGALWHIFAPRDADKIRDMLNKVAIERGAILERNHDSIHDQSWYLDSELRDRLYHDYKVQAYTIVQCLGDAVFVPAGAPHQVRNLHSCIKVAEDFVSPENVSHCFTLTQQFRELSDTHSNHEDKLQVKNIIFHAVKDSLSVVEASQLKQQATNGGATSGTSLS